MTIEIRTDDGNGDKRISKVEKLAVDGYRIMNRITWADGRVTVSRQGGDGPYHLTQADWDAAVSRG